MVKNLWRKFLAWLTRKKPVETTPQPEAGCACDLTKPLCDPDEGQECPVPFGKDIRFLGWSPSNHDWVFIGYNSASCSLSGNMLTGRCFKQGDKQYHFVGHRQKSSSATMLTDRTVECKPCHRLYFECRQ